MFNPLAKNMKQRLELIEKSMSKEIAIRELSRCESLEDFYRFSKQVENGIISQMQVYVLQNFEKVPLEIWNKSSFRIHTHLEKDYLRFGKEDVFTPKWTEIRRMMEAEKKNYDKSIKIESIKFTLDEIDGDFSVKFNNKDWSFIFEDDILDYYYTIKNYLNEKIS